MSRYQLPNPFMYGTSLRSRIVFDDDPSPSPSSRPDPSPSPEDNPNVTGPMETTLSQTGGGSAASPSGFDMDDMSTWSPAPADNSDVYNNDVLNNTNLSPDPSDNDTSFNSSSEVVYNFPDPDPDPSPSPTPTFLEYNDPPDDNYTPYTPPAPDPTPVPNYDDSSEITPFTPTPTPTPTPNYDDSSEVTPFTPDPTGDGIPDAVDIDGGEENVVAPPTPDGIPDDTDLAGGEENIQPPIYDPNTLYASADGKLYMGDPNNPENLFTGEAEGVQFVDGVAITNYDASSEVTPFTPPGGEPTPGGDGEPTPTSTPSGPNPDPNPEPGDGPTPGDDLTAEQIAYNNLSDEEKAKVDSGELVWNAETGTYEAASTTVTAGGLPLSVQFPDGTVVNGTVDADGNVLDENGNVIGTWDGTTFTRNDGTSTTATLQTVTIGMNDGTTITGYDDGQGNIFDANGNQIGTINDQGQFVPTGTSVDEAGSGNTGTVDTGYSISGGVIYDANGNIIGYEDGYKDDTETLAENLESATGTNTAGMSRAEIINLIEEYMNNFNSADYDPAAFMNAFGFALDPNFSGAVIPTFLTGGQSGVYMRRLVKDRDTGELRYIDVPIGGAFSTMTDNQRMQRRQGFGTAINF